ncbi:MAG: aspartyl-phosphate phosphatase Spo0E family protein [Clostridiaceae bacterium]
MDNINERLAILDHCITELRESLNEAALTTSDFETRLAISQSMDELIVEYMKLKNSK